MAKEVDNSRRNLINEIKELQSERSQLMELEELEGNYTQKLVASLRQMQLGIEAPIPLHIEALGGSFHNVKEAYLGADAVVIIVDKDGNYFSRPLSQFNPAVALSIIEDSVAELRRLVSVKRIAIGIRVSLLENLLKELKKLVASFNQLNRETEDLDLIQGSIAEEQGR